MSNTANPKGDRLKTDANIFIDQAIEMMKESWRTNNVAAYNGVCSLLQYAKESHSAFLTESEPDFGFAHWASAMGWVFDFADEMWYKDIGGDEKIGVSAIKTDQQLYSLYQTHLQETKNKEL